MAGSKGRGKPKAPTPGEGPPSKDAALIKGKVGRKVAAFKATVRATACQVRTWVRGSVASCAPGSQEGAVIEWDGAKPSAVCDDDVPATGRHHHHNQLQQQQQQMEHGSSGPLRISRPAAPGCPGVDANRESCQDGHVVQKVALVTTPPPPMLSEEGSDSTCNVVVTLPSPRCKSSSFHASTLTASAATSGSTNTTYSSASEGPTTSNKAVPNSSCSPVAGVPNEAVKAAAVQLVRQVTRYRAHQQQALADAKATIHPLKGQLCRARCLSKRHLAAAVAQADTAAAYLQQVSRLQQALVREGAGRALAEAEAARQGALAVSLEQEVADLTTQLAALKQQLQQQASSAGKALRQAGYEKDMAELQVEQLAEQLQQQQAGSEAALTQAQGERDVAQQQVQWLSTQLQQVQGRLAGCQQELVEARAALPTPEQLQQYGQWYQYYQAYPALHAAYQEQGTQLQQAVSEQDSVSQALTQTQQQLQQVLAERDSLAQQLGAVVAMCNTKQQQVTEVQGQVSEVQQQLEATQQRNQRLMRLVADHDEQLEHAEQELQEAQEHLAQERERHQETKSHLHGERAKACLMVTALNEVLAMVGPGRVVGVGKFGDVAGSGAQGPVQRVSLCVQLGGGKTPQEAEQEGLTPPKRPGKPWKEKAVMKLGEPRGAAQEVALAALATVKSAASDGLLLGPRLRYVQLGRFGEKPRLFFELWGGNLWQLLTQYPLKFVDRLRLVEGMSEGMYNLHVVLGIAWFDCKPANFLVRQLEEGDWEITPADYGFSRDALTLANEQRRYKGPHTVCSPGYTSPKIAALVPEVRCLAAEPGQNQLPQQLQDLLAAPQVPLSFGEGKKADKVSLCVTGLEALLVTPGDDRQLAERLGMVALEPLINEDNMSIEEQKERRVAAGQLLDVWGSQVSAANLVRVVMGQLASCPSGKGEAAAAAEGVVEEVERLCRMMLQGMQSLGQVDLMEVSAAARELREVLVALGVQ